MLPETCSALSWTRRLAARHAHLHRLDAVVHRVAHQMGERIGDFLHHRLVELGVGAADLQLDVLAQLGRGIPHHPGEALEGLADGHHPQLQRAVTDLFHQA